MKIFISWSGKPSQKVAELFKVWLKCVIQACEPWVSTEDIEAGSVWFNEISEQLSTSTIGIICLTKENKDKPWILFETGALTKGLSTNRVCPFLIDLEPSEITPPLSQLNVILSEKSQVRKLVLTINSILQDKRLPDTILETVFEKYWPDFESKFNIIKSQIPTPEQNIPARDNNDILTEILSTVRSFDKRLRLLETTKKSSNSEPEKLLNDGRVYNQMLVFNSVEQIARELRDKGYTKEEAIIEMKTMNFGNIATTLMIPSLVAKIFSE